MSLIEISKEASRLIEKAREGKLLPAEYTGGTFNIQFGNVWDRKFHCDYQSSRVSNSAVSATERAVVVTNENGEDEIIRPR